MPGETKSGESKSGGSTASEPGLKPGIDLRSVPKTRIVWSTAFRLRPASVPDRPPLAKLGPDVETLTALKDLTSPSARHSSGNVLLGVSVPPGAAQSVLSAFSSSLPEWRFVADQTPHMLLSDSLEGAVMLACEIYGQFMLDTAEGPSTLSFIVERFTLAGTFHDISDRELFPSCYDSSNYTASQRLLADVAEAGADGLVFSAAGGSTAVLLRPECVDRSGTERAVALEWDGHKFIRAYDYRDMYWRALDPQ